MKSIIKIVFLGIFILSLSLFSFAGSPPETAKKVSEVKESTIINWLSWEEMVKLNEVTPKKIFIDFYTSWCGWCKVMDRNTFGDDYVAELMSKNFYCVKFDAERKDNIEFQGKTWTFLPGGRSGYHQLAAYFMQNELSYPTMCILTPKYELITPVKGYLSPPQFEPVITFVAQDFWMPSKGKNFEEYKQNYKSGRATPWVQPQ